jgi:hypothetical protein
MELANSFEKKQKLQIEIWASKLKIYVEKYVYIYLLFIKNKSESPRLYGKNKFFLALYPLTFGNFSHVDAFKRF